MANKNYKIIIKKTSTNKRGGEIIDLLQNGGTPVGQVLFAKDNITHTMSCFMDIENAQNSLGRVTEITDEEGNATVPDGIADALKTGYEASIIGLGEAPNTIAVNFMEIIPDIESTVTGDTITNLINEVVKKGYVTLAEVTDRVEVMKQHRFPEEMIAAILSQYRKYKKPVKKPKTLFIDPYPEDEQSVLSLCALDALIGRATIYEGDKSVGKNVATETLAWLLNKPLYLITFNRYMCQDDVYGAKTTVPPEISLLPTEALEELALASLKSRMGATLNEEEAKAAAKFEVLAAKAASVSIELEEAELIEWIKDGGVMCFNEMNMAEANFFSSFANQLTDGTGFLSAPGFGRLSISPDCTLIGTQNANYTGVCDQNGATMSRFGCIGFKYPRSIKGQLKAAVEENTRKVLQDAYFAQCDELYKGLLNAVQQGIIENDCLNIRGFVAALNATAYIPNFVKLKSQVEIQVVNTCPADDRTNIMAQVMDKINL